MKKDAELPLSPLLEGVIWNHHFIDNQVRIAFAREKLRPDAGSLTKQSGKLCYVEFEIVGGKEGENIPLLLDTVDFVNGLTILKHHGNIEILPKATALLPNYPNPFNPETWIPYQLSAEANVTIEIYDIQGRLVRIFDLEVQPAGSHLTKGRAVHWNGKNEDGEQAVSGVYFYQLKAEYPDSEVRTFSAVRRLVVIK